MLSTKRLLAASTVVLLVLVATAGYFGTAGADTRDQLITSVRPPIETANGETSFGANGLNRIAFVRPQPETGSNANIWIMNADGTNQTQLAFLDGDVRQPALSPDGKRIAYVYQGSGSERRLYVMNSDGSNLMQLPITGNSQIPVWSPDGSQIALQNDSDDWWEVWIVNAGGSNPHRITTHSEAAGSPSWSPDGQRLVYLSEPTAFYHDLYIINSDGTGQVLLSSAFATGYSHHRPAWSPDGTQIATIRYTAGTLGPYDLWVMNSDGSNGKVIVQAIDNYVVNRLSWSPDGSSLIFSKNGQVWSVKRDGTQLTQITTTGGWEPSIGPGLAACQPQANESDIVLVLDRSGSMGSDNKLNDAKSAIATFLSSTNAPPDQVSLVSFADAATLDQLLTTNKAAVNAAAQALVASGTTRIDLALLVARTELASERHIATHAKIIILLTDGQQNPAGNDPVLAEANAAKAEGAIIYTIGLGPDADAALLQQIATSPGHYYFAPTSAQLDDIYRQISAAITCPDIGGQVYVDKDNNSQYTPGTDTALAGVIINMSGSATGQAVSQVDGSYRFADNFPGMYTLTLNLTNVPPGYAPIAPTMHVISLSALDDLDNHFGLRSTARANAISFTYPQPNNGSDINANTNIWIMNADGSNRTQLTTFSGLDRQSALSPDGSSVIYISYQTGRDTVWMINSDGSNPVQLPVNGNSGGFAWSPDGSRIAFSNDSVDWWEIWVMNADGSNLHRLTTHGPAAGGPSWSPDGNKIVYTVNPAGNWMDVYVVNSDGTGQSLLVSSTSGFSNSNPAWSADGTQIATVHWPSGNPGPYDLWVMNANGSGGHVIASNVDSPDQNITWSSDSNWLVFGKGNHIWRVRRDGTDLTQITTNGGWEPATNVSGFGAMPARPKVYLPTIFRNYCAGPIVDNFSNPASGWPIEESAYWSYSYFGGEYRMVAKASAFAGVSRGDRPSGQFSLEVDARNASSADGTLGLILGLTDDWRDFYTFEVYPPLQIGAIWHNQNGSWSIVTYATSSAIQTGQATNHLQIQASTSGGYHADFYVNGVYITSMSIPYAPTSSRRVGLTASADPGFDARFDNYKIVLEGCPSAYQPSLQQNGEPPAPLFESIQPGDKQLP